MTMGSILLLLALLRPLAAFNAISQSSTIRRQCKPNVQHQAVCLNLAASTPKNTRSTSLPGSELFPTKGSSYVPYGLTEEQYKQIKAEEESKKSKMNYGAWGPKFAQSERPDGDWMVMSSLWTHGFGQRKVEKGGGGGGVAVVGEEEAVKKNWRDAVASMKRHAPAYLVSYLLIDTILIVFSLARTAKTLPTTTESIFTLTLKMLLWKKKLLFLSIWKMKLLECTAAMCLLKPIESLVERTNRKRLWSPRRTLGVLAVGCVLVASSLVSTLALLQ